MLQTQAFELIREEQVKEINSLARLYRHRKTGAEVLSLINDDENKVFGIVFKTPPEDSTGIAHILEHSVLCGSRKYPVKKPFVELMKGSLHTFLNAMTFPDKTAYPVASQNLQDFYNLVDVYLDAVFFPLISEDVFRQEGWHYELEGGNAPLTFKGVVFNEMKGAYSSPAAILGKATQQSIYPDITYGVDSGGDPKAIPDLTYGQFKAFHAKYYHPSNARIVFYGDDDPEQRLALLEPYLSQFQRADVDADVQLQPRFATPRQITRTYAASPEEAERRPGMVQVSWMLDEVADAEEALALNLLEHVLVGNSAAPLRKALTDSGLGEGLTGSGYAEDYRQPMFTVGMKGIELEDAPKVEALILETLGRLAAEGIDKETIEASVNTAEFHLRENNTGSFPRGMAVMFRSLRDWVYGRDPLAPLAFEVELAGIKARLAAGEPLFETLIRTRLLENLHRTTVVLKPDTELASREEAEERARLDAVRNGLDAAGLKAIEDQTRALKALQETVDPPEALAKIPTLTLEDLPRINKPIPIERGEIAGARLFTHELPTSGIIYLDVGFDLTRLPPELVPYLPIFSRALLQTGTAREDFVSLTQRIGRSTGGIGPQRSVSMKKDASGLSAWLFLRGKAVPDKSEELLAIMSDVLLTARLDNKERIRQMALEAKAGFESGLAGMGNSIVTSRLRAAFSPADWANEQCAGVSQLFFLRELIARIETDWASVETALGRMRNLLIDRSAMVVNVTAEEDGLRSFLPQLEAFVAGLPANPGASQSWPLATPRNEGLTFPGQVNYVGKGANLYGLGYVHTGATSVALRHLNTSYLWDRIRVQGGAYGGSSSFDAFSGGFSFASYRDPNLIESLSTYDQASAFLREGVGQQDLVRSIIGVIGTIDTYRLPDAKGFVSLMWELTDNDEESRQKRREEVLGAAPADFQRFADILDAVAQKGQVVVLGSERAVTAANDERGGFLEVTRVL